MKKIFKNFVLPVSQDEDVARREFILNVLLLPVIFLSFIALAINFFYWMQDVHEGKSMRLIFSSFYFFVFLYLLSRKGHVRISSLLLLATFFLPVTYQIYSWGVDIPAALLAYVVIIFISGILINKYFTFIATVVISLTLAIIGYFQVYGVIRPNLYWKTEHVTVPDIIIFVLLLFIIATVSWLSNREIEKSLTRARRSEAELKAERDSLEITVETKTRELKETQAEKMTQLYRFAEFGRLSSGLFHDLINPLSAVSLNVEKIKNAGETKRYVDKAIVAARKMEDMISAVRKQLSRQENKAIFSLNSEIGQAIDVLSHKAMKAGVKMRFHDRNEIKTYGDAIKFNQVALNLLTNAIDAGGKTAEISLTSEKDEITLSVKDDGTGIKEENMSKIFEPFFTTKAGGHLPAGEAGGMGIGLSMTKRIVEKDFGGNISVESKEGEGSTFTVKFPQKNKELTAG